jgi:hypothetical protein
MLHENPGRPGLVRQVVSVLIGHSEAIDMDCVQIEWNREADHENISRTMIAMHVCPNLTVSNTLNLLPDALRIQMTGWNPVNNSR